MRDTPAVLGGIRVTCSVSESRLRTHVSRAMVKPGARDRAQLVVFAIALGLRVD